jgi:CheY-like chemotaxis protein
LFDDTIYKSDILIAKKSAFEAKLIVKALSDFDYTYEIASSRDMLESLVKKHNYKVVLFDKDYDGLNLEDFTKSVKDNNSAKNLPSKLVTLYKAGSDIDNSDSNYVDEMINKKIDKELLKELLEKLI